eukprot:38806_1
MSIVIFWFISTLIVIAVSVRLTLEQFQELNQHKYFIFPHLVSQVNDWGVGQSHPYAAHKLRSLTQVLNEVHGLGAFQDKGMTVIDQETKISSNYNVPIFIQTRTWQIKDKSTKEIVTRGVSVEYHCYHVDDVQEELKLLTFYHHVANALNTQSTPYHTVFRLEDCRMLLRYKGFPDATIMIGSEYITNVYVRVADHSQAIWWITPDASRGSVRGYEFWKDHVNMFDSRHIHHFDHSFVFNPVYVKLVRSAPEAPCEIAAIKDHMGIVLVDKEYRAHGYIKAPCLVNLHLKNFAKQWAENWFELKPMGLHIKKKFIGNKVPNNGGKLVPPTVIDTSIEAIQRRRSQAQIKWNQPRTVLSSYIREVTVHSAGDCICSTAKKSSACADLCTKKLYLLPSDHTQAFSADNLADFVNRQQVGYLITELDTHRFNVWWNNGEPYQVNAEVFKACELAVNPKHTGIKRLVLADLEPYYMYSIDPYYYSLLRPKYNDVFPIWADYYFELNVHIRNHVMTLTLNGVVLDVMKSGEVAAMPIGMSHFDPISTFMLDKHYPVAESDESETDEQRILKVKRKEYKELHQSLITYFGHGMADLLEHPQKLKQIYNFGVTQDEQLFWMTNHKQYWN